MAATWQRDYLKYQKQFLGILVLYRERSDIKAFIEILLSIFTIIIFFLFAIRPTARTIAQLIQENKGKEETISIMEQKIKNLTAASDLYQKEKDRIQILATSIPDNPDPSSYQRQFEGILNKDNLSPISESFGPTQILGVSTKPDQSLENGALGFPVSLNITGNYDQLFSYLSDIENMRRPLFPTSIGFSSDIIKSTNGTKQIVLTINGLAIYFEGIKK
ncbi:hypothetical protein HYS03_02095 [Candidatus Woesebacteria bacterium]|nr:hypothetical protein [Candidatus Woesebacteria bacterium]QQG47737.1 MAG: hypothetical protein HY044_01450 [Candidatus Woesebacteria bacterium]